MYKKAVMDLKTAIVISLTLAISGCNDYPGHKPFDPVKLSANPSWGELANSVIGGDCNIDSINDRPGSNPTRNIIHKEQYLTVKGWAALSILNSNSPSNIVIALKEKVANGTRRFVITDLVKRPDVAEYFKNPGAISTGFNAVIDLSGIPTGEYELEIFQNNRGVNTICQYTGQISIV
jgi:hypothetical protein